MHRVIMLSVVAFAVGCDGNSEQPAKAVPERASIAVTSYPLLVMAEAMAGSAADIELVVSGDLTSPDWKPTADAIHAMQQATRILISGGDYEPWLQRVTVPRSRLIDTARGHYDQFVRIPDAVIHQHGPDGGHSHPGVVWATWLDPQLAMSQSELTRDVLLDVLPGSEATIRSAADGLNREFLQLDERLEELAAASADAGITVLGDAPVYQYLTARLGWKLNYVHLSMHGPLSEEDRTSLQKALVEQQPTVVFVRSTLADELAGLQAGSKIRFILIDLCELPDDGQTLVQRMTANLDSIEQMLAVE
jgi:zinc transport system substrate-binding protein